MNIGNIPPSILRSINAQAMMWKIALSEAIDNSFDSGSNWVRIVFASKNQLEIIDDGLGCADIEKMLTIGLHVKQTSTKLGRFGVGLKELACWLWGEIVIQTVHSGVMRKASVDWEKLAKQKDWEIANPVARNAVQEERGTRLTFRKTTRNKPSDVSAIADELGYIFAPALWQQKQIVIEFGKKKLMVVAWKLPEFEGDVVRDTFLVNGKQVELVAGVVSVDAVNSRKGFTFIHEHRQLLNSALGSKGKSVSRLCGTVVLGPEWKLGKNKDAIQDSDDQIIALEDAIFSRCQDVFSRAEQQSSILRNTEIEGAVNKSLQSLVASSAQKANDRKAKRSASGEQSGGVKPSGSGRRHKKAKLVQDGDTFSSIARIGQVRFEWEVKHDNSIGWFDEAGKVLYLNELHPRLSHHKEKENIDAIADICCTVLVGALLDSRDKSLLPCMYDCGDLTSALSKVLSAQQESDELVKV